MSSPEMGSEPNFAIGWMSGTIYGLSLSAAMLVVVGIVLRDAFYLWAAFACELIVPPVLLMRHELMKPAAPPEKEKPQ